MRRCVVVFLSVLALAGCASTSSQDGPTGSAILPPEVRAQLQPGEGPYAPDQVYASPAASPNAYDSILLDPLLYFAPLEQMRLVSPDDRQVLLNNLYILLRAELAKDYSLVRFPAAGVARVQFAILPETRDAVVLDTVSTVEPGSGEAAVVQDMLASPLLKGRAFVIEAEWTDSVTGEVLGATVDRNFGRRSIDADPIRSWADVNALLRDYAVLLRYRLCRFREGEDCVTPPAPLG
ncbi:DUF3313 domain-containing protein [Pelagibius sp.]|uniref:DUF3313 domain-containing protein n=1 Tax=Pelagibius sp. TaxID=1931238 RepID=UPI003B502F54